LFSAKGKKKGGISKNPNPKLPVFKIGEMASTNTMFSSPGLYWV